MIAMTMAKTMACRAAFAMAAALSGTALGGGGADAPADVHLALPPKSGTEAKCSAKCAGEVAERCAALSRPVLGSADKYATWSAFYERLFALDAAADEEWTKVSSVPDFDARREALRRKMMDRIGDTVIEFAGDTPEIIEDYTEDLREMIPE